MWLRYALHDNGELVYIEQVPRGQTDLRCPYCGGLLTAKKGFFGEFRGGSAIDAYQGVNVRKLQPSATLLRRVHGWDDLRFFNNRNSASP